MKFLIPIILATLFFGCKAQLETIKIDSQSIGTSLIANDIPSVPFAVINSEQKKDSLFTHISKGACFGNCPTYLMHIYSSGIVTLKAIKGLEKKGLYRSFLTSEQMMEFLLKAKEIRYAEKNDVYDNQHITDLPMVVSSIVIDGSRKVVKRRYDYPKELLLLEKLFDNLLDDLAWEKIQDNSAN